jgi:glycosyltransferase involved in cell wall biosynthesis
MKILHVTKKYPNALGGDAIVVAGLEKQQTANSHEVRILTTNCDEIKKSRHIYKVGLKDKPANLDKITVRRLVSLIILYFRAFKILKSERPDVIHAHSIDMAFFVSFAARRYRIPLIQTFHAVTFNDPREPAIRRKSELFLLRRARPKKILVLSPTAVKDFQKAGFENVDFIPNGVDMETWAARSPKKTGRPFTFLAVGRLEEIKGFKYLINAAAELRKDNYKFKVYIAGDGSSKQQLQDQIDSLDIGEYVTLLGSLGQKQLKDTYDEADAFVLSSLSEAMPIALLEAWAAGLPTIVTKVKDIPLMAGDASLQVAPSNAAELKKAMASFLSDRKLTKSLAKKSYELAQTKYQWSIVNKNLEDVYQDATRLTILHIADFVPPYLEGGGGGAISTIKNIEFLSNASRYYVLTRKHQPEPWNYAKAQVYPALPKIVIIPRSLSEVVRYVVMNSMTRAYKAKVKKYVKLTAPDLIYITSNCLPLMRSAIKTKVPTFIDIRDDYFNDPIMSRRVPKERNQFVYLYRHAIERGRIPGALKPFAFPVVAGFLVHAKLQRLLLRRTILSHPRVYFIALSNYIKLKLVEFGIPDDRITTVYNSADIDDPKVIYGPSDRNNDIVFAGIIEKTKGIWTVLGAAENLKDEPINFILIGDGPELAAAKQYVDKNGLKRVKFMGKLSHKKVVETYSKASVILGPSIWPEPFGRFIQESIATQTPLIATKVGGIPEGVKPKVTGLLIDPGDVEQLTESILQLFQDKALYKQIFNNLSEAKKVYSSDKLGAQRLNYMVSKSGERL